MSKYRKLIYAAILTFALAFVLSNIARALYFNPRPFVVGGFEPLIPHAPDNGFPSDHALLFSAIASVAMFLDKRLSILLWILAAAVGFYRVYAGIHHVIDILASFGISILSAYVAYAIIHKLWNKNRSTDSPSL
ncbi:MAG: hypothetical protein A3J09_01620 [Candidatus Zambryskibacteria bacterium RIFCSPLOWO2_02_FULL_51_21]|uniref:Phosphatidic acid phosphatase type 2/haloperoxidase domain-containing protein n=1 Tax=Candidatus Zambryskibacteria bacterium RIFCSPHIGHO2_02_FULL_43_37 TaxID=1802749 RepID=A0A1G2TH06_9BACT|nr:MAG: hypothetical protein A2723_01620 [Candidatus Zambryskibacteria bacterium RIFCSPHIGHO2_01_FULL_52_18]OHA96493.1 MAG: hypothetical protein A3D49_01280 [Candidatus Zambryskibacteria bacterium RIFCSPHIGHO2_02_FULL_43_37]OHB07164.1 MAG: hypothetical protein A2944_01045 [Candidatus Zambryskibacteria bacterium RIFCSPLOWO2_01_FULL_52_12]OHB11243.1 MAG: hypothetical protein A3J09_01620 [Candidatus Zambryskibacteria bacterium RIFCSPLOWO2_02_FULL_51_21]